MSIGNEVRVKIGFLGNSAKNRAAPKTRPAHDGPDKNYHIGDIEQMKLESAAVLRALIGGAVPVVESALVRFGCHSPSAGDWARGIAEVLAQSAPVWGAALVEEFWRNNEGRKIYLPTARRRQYLAMRQAFEAGLLDGGDLAALCRKLGCSKRTGYRWKKLAQESVE